MATIPDDKFLPLGPWPRGINNRTDETTVPKDQLRAAVNVDLTKAGNPRTRLGTTRKISGISCHSVWSKIGYPFGLFVTANTLTAFDTNYQTTTIRTGLKPAQPISYAEINNTVFWSNGFDQGRVELDLVDRPFGLEAPIGTPTLTASTGDALTAGYYQVAVTFMTDIGEESGSTLAVVCSVAANGKLTISQIPQPSAADITTIRVYITEPNGDKLYWLDDVPVGTHTLVVGVLPSLGKELPTQWLSPMPPGHIVRYCNGRLWVASGNVVWYGSAFHHGQVRRSQHFVIFPDTIAMLEAAGEGEDAGVYIASGKRTWYVPAFGKHTDIKQMLVHPFGAITGTGITVPGWWFDPAQKTEAVYWMDTEGVPMLGGPGGTVRPLTTTDIGNYYVSPLAESGSSLARDINGIRQILTNLRGSFINRAAASDSLVATVHRNGVVI